MSAATLADCSAGGGRGLWGRGTCAWGEESRRQPLRSKSLFVVVEGRGSGQGEVDEDVVSDPDLQNEGSSSVL